jgi:hypothetical protein
MRPPRVRKAQLELDRQDTHHYRLVQDQVKDVLVIFVNEIAANSHYYRRARPLQYANEQKAEAQNES